MSLKSVKAQRYASAVRFFLLILLTVMLSVGCDSGKEIVTVVIGGEPFRVEVARTPEEQRIGLMHRDSLGRRSGMIFVYQRDRRLSFWMKDTRIPLNIAFLNREGVILQIEPMEPFDLTEVRSEISARYALEVNRGAFEEMGVGVGDRVLLPEEW